MICIYDSFLNIFTSDWILLGTRTGSYSYIFPIWGWMICSSFLLILALDHTVTLKVDPSLTLLSTSTYPFIYSIILLQMLRPNPVPCLFTSACSSSFPKSMNKFLRLLSEIPGPWSSTSILNLMKLSYSFWFYSLFLLGVMIKVFFFTFSYSYISRIMTLMVMLYSSFVNLIALDKKLRRTCIYLCWSPYIFRYKFWSWDYDGTTKAPTSFKPTPPSLTYDLNVYSVWILTFLLAA